MPHPSIELIERRASANHFDPSHVLPDMEIQRLIDLATRAPTAFNLQNWRFIAVRMPEAKTRLFRLAYGQNKILDAAVTFIICGQLPNHELVRERLRPFVEAGLMPEVTASGWQENVRATYAGHAQACRDEAIRSASLSAGTLIHAAGAMGLVSGPMVGFDAPAVSVEFGLTDGEIPVMLLSVGREAPGNWPQKPRRPLSEVLQLS